MRDFFLKDFGWKLFSLCLAIGIWVTVHNILDESLHPEKPESQRTNIYSNQPVRVVSSTWDVHGYQALPNQVKVTLLGPAEVMADLKASEIHATVDLSGTNISKYMVGDVEVSPPPKVTVVSVEPSQVQVLARPGGP